MQSTLRHMALSLVLALVVLVATPLRFPFTPAPALAVEPDEMLKDPKLEARARRISQQLRCLVCQNENIDESNADLARDIRILLRERLKAGDTDEQAIQFIVKRYGEYVLLKPRFAPHTFILWIGPFLVLGAGLVTAAIYMHRRVRGVPEALHAEAPLSREERERLEKLLEES